MNGVQIEQFTIYGDNQKMLLEDWNDIMNQITKDNVDKFLPKSTCLFEKLCDVIRKRLATNQKLKSINYLEIFNRKDILKPYDRELMIIISKLNQHDSKNVWNAYVKMPGACLPLIHRNLKHE
jgi:hypothetical protein